MRAALMILTVLAISSGSPPTAFAGPTPVYAYIFNAGSKDVTVIDTASNAVIKTVPLGASVRWLLNEQR